MGLVLYQVYYVWGRGCGGVCWVYGVEDAEESVEVLRGTNFMSLGAENFGVVIMRWRLGFPFPPSISSVVGGNNS